MQCNRLKEVDMEGETAPLRLVLRMMYLNQQEKLYGIKNDTRREAKKTPIWTAKAGLSFADATCLESHADHFPSTTKLTLVQILMRLSNIVEPEVMLSIDVATKLFFQIQVNAHSIVDENKQRVGIGLYPASSCLNHSCRPNCVFQIGKYVLCVMFLSISVRILM
jgi:hypothetical protein